MNRVAVLCRMHHFMMEEFSRRTTHRLGTHTLFRLTLPVFSSFLDINVRKEVDKDKQVILRAAELLHANTSPNDADVNTLLQQARQIDQDFLRQITVFPINIKIDYARIEQIRQQRIGVLLRESHRLLQQWAQTARLTTAIKSLHDARSFQTLLYNNLNLYRQETAKLSSSVKIPALLFMARDALTQTISDTMQSVAEELARELTRRIFRH